MAVPQTVETGSTTARIADAELELTVLMPCLNEADTVALCVERAQEYLVSREIDGEVVVVDNGSTDDSVALAEAAGARVIHEVNPGYGSALRAGIRHARGEFIVMGDADMSYDFGALDPFLSRLREGYDLVMGNRFEGGIRPGAMPFLHRYLGNPVLTWIGGLLFRSDVRDFHCGLRGFRRSSMLSLDLTCPGMEFASEMVVRATLANHRVCEVPTTLSPDGRTRAPHLRTWRDGWRHLRFLLLFSPRWLFLYPGMALTIVGAAVMLWLAPGGRHIGSVGFNVNTLLYAAAAVVCGFQAMSLGILARTYAAQVGLLPSSSMTRRLTRLLSLEAGIAVGLLLILAGLAGGIVAAGFWGARSFGPLDPLVSLRIVIPSATALVLGGQIILVSFFISLLGFQKTGV
jgi:hypothetical protein